ncbi:MAG: hypothetical protein IKO65_06950 [Victivallales bacterium]|nr:hypothetical protein [Victivallales bacterium]
MKRLLQVLLFWNALGTGVFFALGVLMVLPWLLLTYGCLWPMGTTGALEAIVGSWLDPICRIVVKLLLYYALLILFLGWLRCVCHNPNRTRSLVWAAVTLCLISAVAGIFLNRMDEELRWVLALTGVLLALCWTMHLRIRLWQSVLMLSLWGGGLILLAMICNDIAIVPGSGWKLLLADIPWCTGHVWGLLAGLGVLAVLGAYWCAGLAIARATAVPLRRLAGWSTRTLWGGGRAGLCIHAGSGGPCASPHPSCTASPCGSFQTADDIDCG